MDRFLLIGMFTYLVKEIGQNTKMSSCYAL